MEMLHPGARWIFRFHGYFGAIVPVIFLIYGLSIVFNLLLFTGDPDKGFNSIGTGFILSMIFLAILFIIIFSEIYARMAYNRWFYEFGEHNLKLERGIIWKKYSNIPYERVQNADVQRGILARMLGFSTVNIQTAGYSVVYGGRYGGGVGSDGHIPAVSVHSAERIRDFLMKKISRSHHSNQGL